MASELTAVRQVVMKASYRVDVVQRQVDDLQKQLEGIQGRMNRMEALLQRLVNPQARTLGQTVGRCVSHLRPSEEPRDLPDLVPPAELENEKTRRIDDLRRINFKSTQGIALMGVPEGNFNFPPTGFSVVATGWEQDQLPNVSVRRIEWVNPKDTDEVIVKYEAQLEDGTIVSKSEEVLDGLDCVVQGDFGIPSWLFGLSLPDAVYDNTGWGSFENLRADRPTQPSCTNWSLFKDKLQVGDEARLKKLKNSYSPETMKITDGTIVGMEEDKKHPQVVRVWDPGTGRGASNFRTVEEMRGMQELQSLGIVPDSEEESFSYSPEILYTANYDMPGYMELSLHHIYNALDEMVDKEGPVMLNPEFVMCDTTLYLEPLLTFSSDNPLDNVAVLQEQLESLPYLCRLQYQSSSLYIINIMEPLLQAYTERSRLPAPGDADELSVIEGQIAWMVHIIAAILKIRQTIGCSQESQELIDAELSARVLQLINITDTGVHAQRYQELSKQRLDRAILIFVQNFRRSYVGDQAMHSAKQLYARLSELLGLNDHLVLLNVIVGKIATNLKCYAECEDVIDHTLSLFLELASGYMTGKLLLKLESTKFIIANHSRENFPFLEEYRCSRSRTTFYYILGFLVFMEDGPVKFRSFMEPLLQVAVNLEATADAAFRTDVVKYAFIGLMRDLRGIAMATNSRRTYGLLFDWMYPSRMPLLLRAISLWADEPEVTTPLLKFMCEFVLNKAQRLTFDSSSPNGILLFREISKLIVAYGSRILLLPNGTDIYGSKYKGMWISLTILSRALCGNYVNFGVFELYGDRALADALDISLKMTLSVPLSDIMAFKKLSKAYYGYMEVLFNNHISFVLNLDTSTFVHIVSMLESGLKGLDTGISTQCASAIDSLAAFYFNNITAADGPPSPAALNLARHIGEFPSLFPQILKTLFEIIIFEDAGNQWSLSRPILSLIMISEQMFSDLRAQILASQPVDQQQRLAQCFDKLMTDVTRNLEPKNRDRFTQNLTTFRQDFRVK